MRASTRSHSHRLRSTLQLCLLQASCISGYHPHTYLNTYRNTTLTPNKLYLTFRNQANILKRPKLYAVWYIMVLVEVVAVVVSSSIWKVVSFKRTHLVERMGLLSLIILGEGIIVMLKAVNTVEKGSTFGQDWNASIFCVIIAAVLVIVIPTPRAFPALSKMSVLANCNYITVLPVYVLF